MSYAARRQTGKGCTDILDVTARDVVEPWGQPVSIFFSVSEKPPGNMVVKSWEAGRGGTQSAMIIKHVEIWPTDLSYHVSPLSVAVRKRAELKKGRVSLAHTLGYFLMAYVG